MSRRWGLYVLALLALGGALMWLGVTGTLRGEPAYLAVAGLGYVGLFGAGVALHPHEKPTRQPENQARVIVDWAVSDVCLNVICPCPRSGGRIRHLDGYTFGRFRCPDCAQTYQLLPQVPADPVASARTDRVATTK